MVGLGLGLGVGLGASELLIADCQYAIRRIGCRLPPVLEHDLRKKTPKTPCSSFPGAAY